MAAKPKPKKPYVSYDELLRLYPEPLKNEAGKVTFKPNHPKRWQSYPLGR